jgi:hypothetical protein
VKRISFSSCWSGQPKKRGYWGPIYSPRAFITVGGVKTSDISDLDRICPMKNSNWLRFGWVGYIQCDQRSVTCYWNPYDQIVTQVRW